MRKGWLKTVDIVATCVLLALIAAGCGAQSQHSISAFDIARTSWDSLSVQVNFAEQSLWSGEKAVQAEDISIVLFDEKYDTLFIGSGPHVSVPDQELGNSERMIIEVCGTVYSDLICDQKGIVASPKRIRLDYEIEYPIDSRFDRGTYDLDYIIERQQFGGESWEKIEPRTGMRGYILAYVEEKQKEPIKVPLTGTSGRFDLTHYDQFRDFKYYLQSKLHDDREAEVRFDVYAGLDEHIVKLASVQRRVRIKTREDRASEVKFFLEQAVEQIISQLDTYNRAQVYVDEWTFDEQETMYSVEVEIRWRSGSFGWNTLRGTLTVQEDGSGGRFIPEEGNRQVRRLWNREVQVEEMVFDSLKTHFEEDTLSPDNYPRENW